MVSVVSVTKWLDGMDHLFAGGIGELDWPESADKANIDFLFGDYEGLWPHPLKSTHAWQGRVEHVSCVVSKGLGGRIGSSAAAGGGGLVMRQCIVGKPELVAVRGDTCAGPGDSDCSGLCRRHRHRHAYAP